MKELLSYPVKVLQLKIRLDFFFFKLKQINNVDRKDIFLEQLSSKTFNVEIPGKLI